jgi:hypothetical protein
MLSSNNPHDAKLGRVRRDHSGSPTAVLLEAGSMAVRSRTVPRFAGDMTYKDGRFFRAARPLRPMCSRWRY